MRPLAAALALAAAATLPAACTGDVYGRGVMTWSSYPYYGYYDGFYGPFYDGYWGTDGFFWYRLSRDGDRYRRDDAHHFRREDPRYQRFDRQMQPPPNGTRMPNYPRDRDRMRDQGRDRGHDRDQRRDRDRN
jgi:hypothetical protein